MSAAVSASPLNTELMFSSQSGDWETPQWLFDALHSVFRFELDVCASAGNAKFRVYYTVEDDALTKGWFGVCWMNPPYGRGIGKWVEKAYESSRVCGATVVCLLPARTDTRWWQDYCHKASQVHFLRGRLKFGGAANSAPFPSAVVVFRPGLENVNFSEVYLRRKS